jgi:MscS family membrane protein
MLSFLWILLRIVDFFGVVFMYRAKLSASKADDMLVPFIKEGVKILLAMFGLLAILGTVFNLNVVTLIGGLGIGGLAVALAAKETLENLLGSFLIFLDKPFIIGDQIKVGSIEGIIEDIGFRSTRIRTFERTVVTVPNKKMVDAELENQTKREHRRARFTLSLTYDASPGVMKRLSSEIEHVLKTHALIEKETTWVRFREFSASSLDLQVNYFVHTPELEKFLEVREEINYTIMELVKKNGLEFALPSTTVYMKQSEKPEEGRD